ncbi:MAG TPA: DUF2142 domain-containing protein [Solirubrobacteraceae bacterium]|nr:DUF2142 domain-containing protein [Solirubrobacteraceae bacterium]
MASRSEHGDVATRPGVRRFAPAILIALSWCVLLAAWAVSNPPFAAPDEAAHFIRAIGVSEGHLIGRPAPAARIGVDPRQLAWTRQAARLVSLPAGLDPRPFECATGSGSASAACLDRVEPVSAPATLVTAIGNYPPLPYLLPAAVMRAAATPPGALRLGRAAGAVLVLALLLLALAALYDPNAGLGSVVGLLLAVTPMAVFCGASLNGSGLEIAAAIALFGCAIRFTRSSNPGPWLVLAGVTGACLELSRPASPLWALIAVGVAAVLGRDRLRARIRASSRAAMLALSGILVAFALSRVWEARYGSSVPVDTSQLHAGLVAGFHEWWRAIPELVGKFGYVDVKLPVVIPVAWIALVGLLVASAIRLDRANRVLLGVLAVGSASLPILFYALLIRPTGFGLQGRQLLPAMVLLPMCAGEVVYRSRALRPRASSFVYVTVACVATGQFAAWYVNSKRFAVGDSGPLWFLGHAAWSPPLGWGVWFAATLLAAMSLAAAGLLDERAERRSARLRRSAA